MPIADASRRTSAGWERSLKLLSTEVAKSCQIRALHLLDASGCYGRTVPSKLQQGRPASSGRNPPPASARPCRIRGHRLLDSSTCAREQNGRSDRTGQRGRTRPRTDPGSHRAGSCWRPRPAWRQPRWSASAAGTLTPRHRQTRAADGGNGNGVLVPPGKRGIILYTVRDAIGRNPLTTDPALPIRLQAGSRSSSRGIGYKQIEFAGFSQNVNAEGGNLNTVEGAQLLRTWLDAFGLEAEGNHGSIPGTDHRRDARPVRRCVRGREHPRIRPHRHRKRSRPAATTWPTGSARPSGGTSWARAPPRTG